MHARTFRFLEAAEDSRAVRVGDPELADVLDVEALDQMDTQFPSGNGRFVYEKRPTRMP